MKKKKFLQLIDGLRQSENLMKESNVFANDDGMSWDWDIITTIFTKVSGIAMMCAQFAKVINLSPPPPQFHFYRRTQAINWILNLFDFYGD